MAVPKKRQSKSRRRKRRAVYMQMDAPPVVACPNCSEPKLPHRLCENCGHYGGQKIIDVDDE